MSATSFQQAIVNSKLRSLGRLSDDRLLLSILPTSDSRPFFAITPGPFPAYPAPAAAATQILRFVVPAGAIAVISKLAIVHIGGGQVDGTGNVIWRASVNGACLNGMENMQAQTATFANPNDVVIVLHENDVFVITAEVPAAQAAQVGSTASRIHGYITPVMKRQAA